MHCWFFYGASPLCWPHLTSANAIKICISYCIFEAALQPFVLSNFTQRVVLCNSLIFSLRSSIISQHARRWYNLQIYKKDLQLGAQINSNYDYGDPCCTTEISHICCGTDGIHWWCGQRCISILIWYLKKKNCWKSHRRIWACSAVCLLLHQQWNIESLR
jgi:hypothetical protein